MRKILCFLLLFMAVGANNQMLFAANNHSNVILSDTCYAPAPDSFRITSVSGNFIALAWESAWPGAEQTLSVLKRNPTGAWEMFLPPFTLQGEAYTVGNLTPGVEYRFIIATNCGPDEPSSLTKVIDGITLILELTIGGRTPINPVPVDCHNINYLAHEWVGFKVETYTKKGVLISSLFEFEPYGDINAPGFFTNAIIKRVEYENSIVATNDFGKWPTFNHPIIIGSNPFRMGHKKPDGINSITIGFIELTAYPQSIDLCVDPSNHQGPWLNSYDFTPLTAEQTSGVLPNAFDDRTVMQSKQEDEAWVQCPFNEQLEVYFPLTEPNNGSTKVLLLNASGEIIIEKFLKEQITNVTFQTSSLASGFYIVRIESSGKVSTLRTAKVF